MSTKFIIEVEVAKFAGEQFLSEMKRDGNTWHLRIDADKIGSRREMNVIISRQISFAAMQLAAAMTAEHIWPSTQDTGTA